MYKFFISIVIAATAKCSNDNNTLKIPDGFLIGTASSAFQIEGAWDVDDKAISIWDHFTHTHPEKIADGSNADVTTDSYHRYKEDVAILSDIGVDHYRFSISWSRLLPKGHAGYVSKSALRYYHKVLDELDSKGIIPFVTIYHWDHPQILEEWGGWLNERMAYVYADYARVVFSEFGHRVKYFITMNELAAFCSLAYRVGWFPPGLKLNGTADYQCLHNQLKAHALAYRIYEREFRRKQNGTIGVAFFCKAPKSYDRSDSESDDLAFEFDCGWQANPIFSKTGDYPKIMKKKVAERSKAQGYKTSRLPTFSKFWINYIKGTADFLGFNYYTGTVVKPLPKSSIVNWPNDEGLEYSDDPNWASTQSFWLKVYPEGLEKVLNLIKNKYNNPVVYITENGIPCKDEDVRISYIYLHLRATISAIKNGCNVKGYTYWSLLDSFEMFSGFSVKFGLIHVDFNSVNRTRTPKKSVSWLKNVLKTRKLDPSE